MKKILVKILVVTMVFSMFAIATVNASDETDPHAPAQVVVQK